MTKEVLNIIILGPQGSGKGTQAKLLANEFNLEHIETGDALRRIKGEATELGKKVAGIIDQGKLVSSALIMEIIGKKIMTIIKDKSIIFDGVPRALDQVELLENILEENGRYITHVFFIQISEKETVNRLSKRHICSQCGKIFIIEKDAIGKLKKCSKCGGNIIRRKDDTPEGIRQRLELYQERTFPVVEYYRQKQKLIEIDGEQPIEKVFKDIKLVL